ncbi:hypothetical protein [Micromonospora sp. NPDC050200]|uniref:hypothetical protein n=1 Tax=Micromonospora sp. NPDC050200 TaxID=3155664 RepID=UPI0033E6F918
MPVHSDAERLRVAGLRVTRPRLAVLAITDTDRRQAPGPCLDRSAAAFAVEFAEVTYWGRCPDCQNRSGGER